MLSRTKKRAIEGMKASPHLILGLVTILIIPLARGQQSTSKQPQTPVETSVCKIVNDASVYKNKLVKIRGYVRASFEYSVPLWSQDGN
jgi:hypothetical protein